MNTHPLRTLSLLLLISAPVAASTAIGPGADLITEQEAAQGWILLFDGKTQFGWQPHADGPWRVADAALTSQPDGKGWLATTTEFADFHLTCRYRISPGAKCGILFAVTDDKLRPRRPGATWTDGRFAGQVLPLKAPSQTTPDKSPWRQVELRIERGRARASVEGAEVLSVDAIPHARGYIGLLHDDAKTLVEFRDIKLRPLSLTPIPVDKDLRDWQILPNMKSTFSVDPEGVLNVRNGHGQISAPGNWSDFVIQAAIKTANRGQNSGIFFRSEPDKKWYGYESQIRSIWYGNDRTKPVNYGTGGIYNRQSARCVYADDGKWFTMTVIAHGRHFATWVNGCQAADWTDPRPRDRNPRVGYRPEGGAITLQGHDKTPRALISFKDFRIAEYPK
ncbi:MAG: DUF1080 domain-containing protein [Phycisphaerae bacterium]|nr:DUF1080 domain-containing protein [Phycisphaerae bacterium]